MPKVLAMLKNGEASKSDIEKAIHAVMTGSDLRYRVQALNWALTNLKKIGWVTNRKRGMWRLSTEGARSELTEKEAKEIWTELNKKRT